MRSEVQTISRYLRNSNDDELAKSAIELKKAFQNIGLKNQ